MFKKTVKLLVVVFTLFLLLISCSSARQYVKFTHEKPLKGNDGRIYVTKPSFVGAAGKVAIFCDDDLIGNIQAGSYLAWDVEEGRHTIGNTQFAHAGRTLGAGHCEDLMKINVKKGKIYYLKISPQSGGMIFTVMNRDKGEKVFKNKKKPQINYID